jgi:acetate kinase
MKIVVLNCGSSSIKYQLFDMPSQKVIAKGLVDKIGLKGAGIKHEMEDGSKTTISGEILDHKQGIEYLFGILISKKYGCMKNLEEIKAVGHRVVHAGEKFGGSVRINDEVIKALEETIDLAPLHNPPNLDGIYAITTLLPEVEQVGVFDTAFHQTMPAYSYLYGVPYSLYEKHGVRRYGFHGSSHKYVSKKAAALLGKNIEDVNIITCHLGNGASIAAVQKGKSLDTSMGMTPIEGLIMGTRSGDLDIGALFHIIKKEEITLATANTMINKFSGMLGVSGVSSDMRDVENAAKEGNERAKLSLKMYQYRVKKYIGAYAAAMGGVDAIVFTGGIGENDWHTRQEAVSGMEFMGVKLDTNINTDLRGDEAIVSKTDSRVKVMVIPTNEELVIASDTFEIIDKGINQL